MWTEKRMLIQSQVAVWPSILERIEIFKELNRQINKVKFSRKSLEQTWKGSVSKLGLPIFWISLRNENSYDQKPLWPQIDVIFA